MEEIIKHMSNENGLVHGRNIPIKKTCVHRKLYETCHTRLFKLTLTSDYIFNSHKFLTISLFVLKPLIS